MTKIQVRRDTATNWTSANPTLGAGEWGLETDTKKRKLGDGTSTWTTLAYQPEGTMKSVNGTAPDTAGNLAITKTTVGLANVDNTADTAKPVSTAQSTAIGAAASGTITQNTNGTWPSRTSVTSNRTTARVTWIGTAPGPNISTNTADAVAGLDVQFVTATIP